ncbi:methyltransferase domain-containing protein [Catenulispora subtropica]|uniref:Methyltransferase domain-containing protein n=1 Tax=Catenulispora subtropica TaxID=450798 RepID=A0ABP5DV07_9ACTN
MDVLDLAYRDGTAELLRRSGVAESARCVEVGAGGGHASRQLAHAVGPLGRVVGVDIDPAIVDLARRDAEADGLDNVEFQTGDAVRLPFEDEHFDVAYARLLLTHLPEPLDALREMVRVTRRGGLVVVEDLDWDGVFCHPPAAGFDRYRSIHADLHRHRGGDPAIGPKLPGLFRRAGLTGIDLSLAHPAHVTGRAKTLHTLTLANIADALLGAGLAERDEIAALHAELEALAADPETVIAQPRIFQVWGRRGAEPAEVTSR